MIDLRYRSAVRASRMPKREIDASIARAFAAKGRTGRLIEDTDLFDSGASTLDGGATQPIAHGSDCH